MAKSKPDWIKAKAMYETGKSLRQIADACFIDNSNISKRAKKEGWQPGIKEATSRGIVPLPNILYLITSEEFRANGIYKIGITNDIEFRIKSMQTGCPFKLFAYKAYLNENPLGIEQSLHSFFSKKRLEGEWFKLSYVDLNYIEEALGNG
jgi:hypothetical protein